MTLRDKLPERVVQREMARKHAIYDSLNSIPRTEPICDDFEDCDKHEKVEGGSIHIENYATGKKLF